MQSVERTSFIIKSGNYAHAVTPNPLPAVNLSHPTVLDHIFYRSQFSVHRESGYKCYKEPEGVQMSARKAIGSQLYGAAHTAVIKGLMRVVTLGGQNIMIQWRLTFIRFFFFFF